MALPLTGCAGSFATSYDTPVDRSVSIGWRLGDVLVNVPDRLTVSEANTLAPDADIVWHGERRGDRRRQVGAIVDDGISAAFGALPGTRKVLVRAQLIHFHSVTPQALVVSPSAVHNIRFAVRVDDLDTRQPLTEVEIISADFEAFVGSAAVTAALNGQSQRVRIVDHIERVMLGWLGLGEDPRRTFTSIGR